MPPMVLLEDAEDLCDFFQVTGRTIRASRWASEVIDLMAAESAEGLF
jgi:hypothetical protein